jgi:D-glycero-alpha-D-manno-heptose 1-phosphate guanylyltransferase
MRESGRIDAVILAGGKGTRLKSVVSDRPKPMAEVAGRPFLEWQLLYLRTLGITRAILCTGYKAESVEDHFNTGGEMGMEIMYSREDSPLGTGGAVKQALPLIKTDPFLVLNGDSLCPFDPAVLTKTHEGSGALMTMLVVKVAESNRFGTVCLDGENYIEAFLEKEPTGGPGLINAGVYLMERSLLEDRNEAGYLSLESDVFPRLPFRVMAGLQCEGPFLDIGTPESYSAAAEFIADHLDRTGEMNRKEIR